MQLMRYRLRHQRINCIFISHLHGDHYFGLFGLLSTMNQNGRTSPMHLFGPAPLGEILPLVFKHSGTVLNYQIDFTAVDHTKNQVIYENDCLTVTTIPLAHRVPTCGFLFREKPKPRKVLKEKLPPDLNFEYINKVRHGHDALDENGKVVLRWREVTGPPKKSRSYAYCSDTSYLDSVVEQVKGVDLLYHEATFMNDLEARAIATFHSTSGQAALAAKRAGAHKLLLGHFSSRYKDLTPLLLEARAIFPESYIAVEGEAFEVEE